MVEGAHTGCGAWIDLEQPSASSDYHRRPTARSPSPKLKLSAPCLCRVVDLFIDNLAKNVGAAWRDKVLHSQVCKTPESMSPGADSLSASQGSFMACKEPTSG